MPKIAAPSFNGVTVPADLRRVLETALRPATAALNKALVVGDSLQVWDPVLVTGTGAGSTGISGSGTTGNIPKWSGTSALADSGASMDGSNRLAVPVGIAFPGGSHLDAAPTPTTPHGSTSEIQYNWFGAFGSETNFQYDATNHGPRSTGGYFVGTDASIGMGFESSGNPGLTLFSYNPIKLFGAQGSAGRPTGWTNTAGDGPSVYVVGVHSGQASLAVVGASGQTADPLVVLASDHATVICGFTAGGGIRTPSTDSTGSPGAATINKPAGKSSIVSGASSVVITNSLVSASSIVIVTPLDIDATLTGFKAVPAAGSFTVTGNANATANWRFAWWVLN